MSGRITFYAPMKAPDHPVPSGDRRMARSLMAALAHAGFEVELAARLRSYDSLGDTLRQRRLGRLGERLAARLIGRYERWARAARPTAWLTYHVYHKAPDWLGPAVSRALEIPYLIVEASHAAKQADGPFAPGLAASERAIRSADVVLAMTAADVPGLVPLVVPPAELTRLAPFTDAVPAAPAGRERRANLAARFGLDPVLPWLLAVGMMRADAKLESYRLLGQALELIRERPWQLLVVGDGPARAEVERALEPLGPARVLHLGLLDAEALGTVYAAADLCVWPAVREAYGLAMLEAQGAGLPVVAGREGGVAEVLRDGVTGLLVPPRDPAALARAVEALLDDPARRARMSLAARDFVARERSLEAAAGRLERAITLAQTIRRRRRCG